MGNDKLRATPAARSLAQRMGVDLNAIAGSGYKGRIHAEDVAEFSYEKAGGITPLAKKIADAFGLDTSSIQGSGFRGKITRADVAKALDGRYYPNLEDIIDPFTDTDGAVASAPAAGSAAAKASAPASSAAAPAATAAPKGDIEIVPMNMMRRVIAKRMADSYFSAPTFVLNYEVDMYEATKLRKQFLEPIKEKTGKKLTVTDIISIADGSQIELHNYVNLAMAVGMDEGLLVPVVHGAEKLGLVDLMLRLKDITERAVGKKLTPADQEGSTFTISNLGMYGVESFTSIINQPNSAILSIAGTKEMPVVRNGEVVIRPIMKMSLTSDHRVINGLAAAKFMQELKATLESPLPLLV